MPLDVVFGDRGWLHARAWAADWFDFWAFDRHVDDLVARGAPLTVVAHAAEVASLRHQLAIRTQRVALVRNRESAARWFDRVLVEHRVLHDLRKPLVRADLDHALDTWQWCVRLDEHASASIQLAALLHDIERLRSEAEVRVEHHARNYQQFKDAHARAGAELARELLTRAAVPAEIANDACKLIATHERRGSSEALGTLNDADALSFLSLNSPGYLAYFGPEQTTKKLAYTLARLSPAARTWLNGLRLPRLIRDHLHGHRA